MWVRRCFEAKQAGGVKLLCGADLQRCWSGGASVSSVVCDGASASSCGPLSVALLHRRSRKNEAVPGSRQAKSAGLVGPLRRAPPDAPIPPRLARVWLLHQIKLSLFLETGEFLRPFSSDSISASAWCLPHAFRAAVRAPDGCGQRARPTRVLEASQAPQGRKLQQVTRHSHMTLVELQFFSGFRGVSRSQACWLRSQDAASPPSSSFLLLLFPSLLPAGLFLG